ncbi:YeiH family protein [Pelistega suis]|uniref:YeiH family putative sulfate export transporter n=1 Tax=Pelistega suis TaxID=1631957 RepID=A0A849P552_9BURK|nr:YeiH family protein [Pelistega suis]NOL51143.1 YeiH family putative sulfate export transporter [Pelistega suis]
MKAYLPGIAIVSMVSVIAILLVRLGVGANIGFSSLSFALFIGLLLGNMVYPKISSQADKGVGFAKSKLLRLGIILYGCRLTLMQVADLGWVIIFMDIFMVISTFLITYFLGIRLLKMDRNMVMLTGAGCSICGASAIMATSPILKAKASEVTQALTVVVLFGTVALFLYPWIYHTWFLPEQALDFGVVVGAAVHEVAQVVAIGRQVGEGAMDLAVLTKMVRVMLLVPFLFILLCFLGKNKNSSGETQEFAVPWFAVGFLAMIALNSFVDIPSELKQIMIMVGQIALTMAMAALGLTTQFANFKKAGPKAFILGFGVFIWLLVAGFGSYALLM